MKILVTGANGYIGAKVVKQLCNYGVKVIATDFYSNNIDSRAKFIKADIFSDKDDWYNFFDKPDVCLHMAWRDGFVHNSPNHIIDLSRHFLFLKNLIDHGIKQVACMGSMHEIGYWNGKIDENTPCNPQTLYGISKNALRKSLELYCIQKSCLFQWLRAYYIYGDDTNGNNIFCKIREADSTGATLFPFTSGKNKFDFIHINDLSIQISKTVMQSEICGVINCCSGKPVALAEQVEKYIYENKLSIKLDYGKFPDRVYDSPCIYGDITKIQKILNMKVK